jgi:hypothetical protein
MRGFYRVKLYSYLPTSSLEYNNTQSKEKQQQQKKTKKKTTNKQTQNPKRTDKIENAASSV